MASDSLSETILSIVTKSAFVKPPSDFLPHSALDRIISKEAILEALDIEKPSQEDDELVQFILQRAKRLFAIAAFIELPPEKLRKAMTLFRKHHFDNDNLPIAKNSGEQLSLNMTQCAHHPLTSMETHERSKKNKVWSLRKVYDFQEKQYMFLAPIITTDTPNHDFWDLTMPFTAKHASYSEGSFGEVSKYEIHPDHIKSSLTGESLLDKVFAVKKIKIDRNQSRQKVAQRWASEVKAMAMMNHLNHKGHIVRFITAFRHGTVEDPELYIITEWADGGNLQDLWREIPKPQMTTSFVKAVLQQLLGIAEAFCAAHFLLTAGGMYTGASYRHGDLKPANILWFRHGEFGTLKICDWGEAKNKQVVTAMRLSKTSAEYGTRRYEPPEVETGVTSMLGGTEEKRRSRLYDIWAIGCITLEMIVWLLYGLDGLESFNQGVREENMNVEAPFYQWVDDRGKKKATVHKVVAYWINYLAKDRACRAGTTALGDLLELVQRGLLVVELPRSGGTFADHNLAYPQSATHGISGKEGIPDEELSQDTRTNVPKIVVEPATDDSHNEKDLQILPNRPSQGAKRFRADQLRDGIFNITTDNDENSYWFTSREQLLPTIPADLYTTAQPIAQFQGPPRKRIDYGQSSLENSKWNFDSDNEFASKVFTAFHGSPNFPMPTPSFATKWCAKCDEFREKFWGVFFQITYDVQTLESNANAELCELCGLLWMSCRDNWGTIFEEATFERSGSFLTMNASGKSVSSGALPVLSISRSPACKSKRAAEFQVGFGELPEADSATHLEILRQWVSECDEKHCESTCKLIERPGLLPNEAGRLPTRLIDVGEVGADSVRLWETTPNDAGEWIALSHQWGPPKGSNDTLTHFSTTTENRKSFMSGISLDELPPTFRDAVLVTRALGSHYLWIDSICIVQEGKDKDFDREAKRMEEVYSGATCVLAASRASNHWSGFLKPRTKREYIAIPQEHDNNAPVFISQAIDNFKAHILEGALSRRAWVYQEHALARRTIFFDDHQTYWECGHGVRCETMTTLQNESAALLGDPNFPRILEKAKQGETIERFQELYKVYSRLDLSKQFDRPTAIGGLQQRLLRTLSVQGGLGVFDGGIDNPGLLRRSLLWRRGKDTPSLNRIDFLTNQAAIPSWSWMAHTGGKDSSGKEHPGGIDYFKPRYNGFDWQYLQSPWERPDTGAEDVRLLSKAQTFDRSLAKDAGEALLIFDAPADSTSDTGICVVLGIERVEGANGDKQNYVLVVVPTKSRHHDGSVLYERVGAGYLPGRCITSSAVPVIIH